MSVLVSTPSRLHFGLLRFAESEGPSYGGLGVMVEQPRWRIELGVADEWLTRGEEGERAVDFARGVLQRLEVANKPRAIRVRVLEAVPAHRGFGGGTQLGLAVAGGVRQLLGLPAAPAIELAALSGRGLRSAVGAHGFAHGGLIWETGRRRGETLGRLAHRAAMPEAWRVVLINTGSASGLSGDDELAAFRTLPSPSADVVARLSTLAEEAILPAAESADFGTFSDGVYRYGRLAGECFAPIQGGPYASAEIAQCVEVVREQSCAGVGQSSWGPTVFAFAQDQPQAEALRAALAAHPATGGFATTITRPDNRGAMVSAI